MTGRPTAAITLTSTVSTAQKLPNGGGHCSDGNDMSAKVGGGLASLPRALVDCK